MSRGAGLRGPGRNCESTRQVCSKVISARPGRQIDRLRPSSRYLCCAQLGPRLAKFGQRMPDLDRSSVRADRIRRQVCGARFPTSSWECSRASGWRRIFPGSNFSRGRGKLPRHVGVSRTHARQPLATLLPEERKAVQKLQHARTRLQPAEFLGAVRRIRPTLAIRWPSWAHIGPMFTACLVDIGPPWAQLGCFSPQLVDLSGQRPASKMLRGITGRDFAVSTRGPENTSAVAFRALFCDTRRASWQHYFGVLCTFYRGRD